MDKSKQPDIPNNDPDRKLSELYKEFLDSGKDPSKIDDPLIKTLANIRDEDSDERQSIPVRGKESSWEAIRETIQSDSTPGNQTGKKATITPIRSRRQWLKVAAAIALIALSALFLVRQFSSPERLLVAEASDSVQTIELSDGSSVTLRPNSALYDVADAGNERAYSLSGEAVFDVVSSPDRIFSVEAGSGRVVVTGTRFNLSERNATARVYLFEGSVRFETEDGTRSVDLEPGEASEIDTTMQIRDPFQFEPGLVTSWTQNRLTFRDRSAGSVMDELEFHFNIEITSSEEVRSESLGGTIQLDSARESLQDLGTVLGGSFEEIRPGVYRFIPSNN